MRSLAFAVLILALPASVFAAPLRSPAAFHDDFTQHDEPRLKMPGEFAYAQPVATRSDSAFMLGPQDARWESGGARGLSFGPVHAESEVINGRRRVHYHVDGLSLMGGEVGGSLGHGGAMLTLHWASSPN